MYFCLSINDKRKSWTDQEPEEQVDFSGSYDEVLPDADPREKLVDVTISIRTRYERNERQPIKRR